MDRLDELIAIAMTNMDEHLDELRAAGVDIARASVFICECFGQMRGRMGDPADVAAAIDAETWPISVDQADAVRKSRVPLAVACIRELSGSRFFRTRALRIAEAAPS